MDTYTETATACVSRKDDWERRLECIQIAMDAEEFMRAEMEAQGYDPECDIDTVTDKGDGLVHFVVTCESPIDSVTRKGVKRFPTSGGCSCGVVGGAGRGSLDLFAPIERFLRKLFS